ncbi:hypothetical protein JOM56_000882 [Amanita muscaria]
MSIHDEDVKPFIAMARCGPSLYYNKRLVIYPFTVASEPPEHLEGSVISLMVDLPIHVVLPRFIYHRQSTLVKKHKTDTICAVKGCWRVKLAKHVRLLNRDERDPADKRGVPLLEILFKWKNIRDHDKLPDQFLALTKGGFLLRFLTRHQELGLQSYGVRFKCDNHTLSWSDVAINIVYGVMEDLEKGNPPIVFDFNHRAYPIPSILHARLVSLVSEDGKVWWPKFSTALIEPTTGQYIPFVQYA